MRRTKIVATLGPASREEPVLRELIRAGLDVARLNFSHGDHESHGRTLELVRRIAGEERRQVAILQDLCGPKVRTGVIEGDAVFRLRRGDVVTLVAGSDTTVPGRIGIAFDQLAEQCEPGGRVFINDGLIELRVESVSGREVSCTVVRGGDLSSRKGVNVPGSAFGGLAALTPKDRADLEWGLKHGVDFVGLSFVRRPEDVLEARRVLEKHKSRAQLVAKIEKPQALQCLDGIVDAADAVMVARGDLGVELDPERVPLVQKDIIARCNARERPVITATQMLESMTHAPRPTRAEVSDVANAIFDGTDAVMLSGETAAGDYPVETLRMMARIAETADVHLRGRPPALRGANQGRPDTVREAIGQAAELLARELSIKVIVAATMDGSSALGISKSRPDAALIGICPDDATLRRMCLYWGVLPVKSEAFGERSELIRVAEKVALADHHAKTGDFLVLVSNAPLDAPGDPNNLRLHQIGALRTGETTMMRMPKF